MSSKIARLARSLCLSVAFVVTVFSQFGGRGAPSPASETTHMIAGALLLLGSLAHIRSNREWIRTVTAPGRAALPGRTRALWRTDRALFVAAVVCALPLPLLIFDIAGPAGRIAAGVHRLGGAAMIVLLSVHLLQHWSWLVGTLRALGKRRKELTAV